MRTDGLSGEISALLRERIEDYEQLEILRLLRSDRDVWWSVAEIAVRLKLDEEQTGIACRNLERNQLSRSRQQADVRSFAYAPATPQIGVLVDQLFQAYRDQPIEVIKQMSANAIERVRTAALQAFADAFVIRRDKKNG